MNLVFPVDCSVKILRLSRYRVLDCVKIISKYPLYDLLNDVEIMRVVNSKYQLPMTHIQSMDQTLLSSLLVSLLISSTRFLNLSSRTVAVSKTLG